MASYPDHIFALRRTHPDNHSHFVETFLPYLITSLPTLISTARDKGNARQAIINPVLSPDTQPWPVIGAISNEPLSPSDYALMVALELEVRRLSLDDYTLHTCNHSPTLNSRRDKSYNRVSFQLAPKMKSYQ